MRKFLIFPTLLLISVKIILAEVYPKISIQEDLAFLKLFENELFLANKSGNFNLQESTFNAIFLADEVYLSGGKFEPLGSNLKSTIKENLVSNIQHKTPNFFKEILEELEATDGSVSAISGYNENQIIQASLKKAHINLVNYLLGIDLISYPMFIKKTFPKWLPKVLKSSKEIEIEKNYYENFLNGISIVKEAWRIVVRWNTQWASKSGIRYLENPKNGPKIAVVAYFHYFIRKPQGSPQNGIIQEMV